VQLATLKTASFRWAKIGEKIIFCQKKNEGSSAAAGTSHYWPHIFSNDLA